MRQPLDPLGESRGDEAKEGKGPAGTARSGPATPCRPAGGLVAAGATAEAGQVLAYMRATQSADGHWPQNMWVSSAQYWTGTQLGETAFPVLLLDLLRRAGALSDAVLARF